MFVNKWILIWLFRYSPVLLIMCSSALLFCRRVISVFTDARNALRWFFSSLCTVYWLLLSCEYRHPFNWLIINWVLDYYLRRLTLLLKSRRNDEFWKNRRRISLSFNFDEHNLSPQTTTRLIKRSWWTPLETLKSSIYPVIISERMHAGWGIRHACDWTFSSLAFLRLHSDRRPTWNVEWRRLSMLIAFQRANKTWFLRMFPINRLYCVLCDLQNSANLILSCGLERRVARVE
jgi:hypothetical protein